VSLDSGLLNSTASARRDGADLIHARAADAIERIELPFHLGPARGILNAVLIGAGAWAILFGGASLVRAIVFG
jgi:hypothetical protein